MNDSFCFQNFFFSGVFIINWDIPLDPFLLYHSSSIAGFKPLVIHNGSRQYDKHLVLEVL